MCGEHGPQKSNFCATLGPKISKTSGLWSFSKTFCTGLASFLVYMSIWATFRGVLNIGLRWQIFGSFWPQNRTWFRSLSHFLKYFPLVSYPSCFKGLLGVCLGVFQGAFPLAAELFHHLGLCLLKKRAHGYLTNRKHHLRRENKLNEANLRDLIAMTGLVILLKSYPNTWNRRVLDQRDLEIWQMTSLNDREPLPCSWKLCVSYDSISEFKLEISLNQWFFGPCVLKIC